MNHPSGKRIRVFIVEPEPAVASTVKDILSICGFEATAFTEPREGLKAALAENPDLVLCAVWMQQLTGIELALQLNEQRPGCKVLLWSSTPETTDLQELARSQGHAFEVLAKPVHPDVLLGKIRELTADRAPTY